MKKKIILPLCALLLLGTTTLSSCNGGSASSTSSSAADQTVQRITLNNSADKIVTIGTEVNLDDYINLFDGNSNKITPSDVNYTVSFNTGSDIATLNGHKLTVNSEGTISLRIQNGAQDDNVKATLSLTGVSAIKKKFYNDTKNIVKNYTVEDLAVDSTGYLEVDDNGFIGAQTGVVHNEEYISFLQGGTSGYLGYLTGADNEVYYYTMDDRFGTNLNVQAGPTGNELTDFYVGADFPISALTDVTTSKDDDGNEVLVLSTEASENFIKYGLGYSMSGISNAGYTITNAEIDYQTVSYYDQDGKKVITEAPIIYTYVTKSTSTLLLSASILEVGDNVGVASVESYISTQGQPDAIADPCIQKAIDSIVAGKNYTVEETFGWFNCTSDDETGLFSNFTPIDAQVDASEYLYLFPRLNTPSVSKKMFNDKYGYAEFLETGYGSTLTPDNVTDTTKKGYTMYSPNSEDATKVNKTTNIELDGNTYKLSDTAIDTVESLGTATDMFDHASDINIKDVTFESTGIASVTTDSDTNTTTVVLNSGKYCKDFLASLIKGSTYNQMGFLGDWTANYFTSGSVLDLTGETVITYTNDSEGKCTGFSVNCIVLWSSSSNGYNVIRWAFDFTDIGTTRLVG